MNYKQYVAVAVIALGLFLIGYAIHGSQKIAAARGDIDTATGIIPKNPFTGAVNKGLQGKVDAYVLPVTLLYVGGVLCIIGGSGALYFLRNKR